MNSTGPEPVARRTCGRLAPNSALTRSANDACVPFRTMMLHIETLRSLITTPAASAAVKAPREASPDAGLSVKLATQPPSLRIDEARRADLNLDDAVAQ